MSKNNSPLLIFILTPELLHHKLSNAKEISCMLPILAVNMKLLHHFFKYVQSNFICNSNLILPSSI